MAKKKDHGYIARSVKQSLGLKTDDIIIESEGLFYQTDGIDGLVESVTFLDEDVSGKIDFVTDVTDWKKGNDIQRYMTYSITVGTNDFEKGPILIDSVDPEEDSSWDARNMDKKVMQIFAPLRRRIAKSRKTSKFAPSDSISAATLLALGIGYWFGKSN